MSPTAEQLFQQIMILPVQQRRQLAKAVLDESQADEAFVIHPAWKEELDQRSRLVDSGEMSTSPWSEVKKEIEERFGRSGGLLDRD